MSCLECRNISKAFGQVRALSDVTMEAKGGEVLALLGGNGSGKSTISKIIGGIYKKDSGQVLLNGREIHVFSPRAAKKERIIVTSQELSLMNNFNVAQNVCMCIIPTKNGWIDQKSVKDNAKIGKNWPERI